MTALGARLRRDLGLSAATAVVVGAMIGLGIFLGPQTIARVVPSPMLILLVWVVGGAIVFAGALTFAELAASLPEAGGLYSYLREAYGEFPAFLSGWSAFMVGKGASTSALAVGFATLLSRLVPLDATGETIAALALIVTLTAVNVVGVRYGGDVARLTTAIKVLALAALVVGGLAAFSGSVPALASAPLAPASSAGGFDLATAFGVALIPAFFAYDGWTDGTQIAEEVRDPTRNVPRALLFGVLIVCVLYALTNLAYLAALGVGGVSSSPFAAAETAVAIFGGGATGDAAATLIVVAVVVSVVGATNAVILSGPRILFAMGRDGFFFRGADRIHPRFATPARAILLQSIVSVLFVLAPPIGGRPLFETLLTYIIFDSFIFYGLGAAAIFVLRAKRPELARPYKAWGYPLVPALFVAASAAFLVNTAYSLPLESLAGVAIVATGLPFYFFWRAKKRETAKEYVVLKPVAFTMRRD
ncbi:MAG: APC family permease [Thermoplasmatota archaeon]